MLFDSKINVNLILLNEPALADVSKWFFFFNFKSMKYGKNQ